MIKAILEMKPTARMRAILELKPTVQVREEVDELFK